MRHLWVVLTARRVEAQLHCRTSGGAGLLVATGKAPEDTVLTHGAFALIFTMCRHFLGGQGDSPAYPGGPESASERGTQLAQHRTLESTSRSLWGPSGRAPGTSYTTRGV